MTDFARVSASASEAAPETTHSTSLVAPSPSRATILASWTVR